MTYKKLVNILRFYDVEELVRDVEEFYNCESIVGFYFGYDWALGLLNICGRHYVYIRSEEALFPEHCFKWNESVTDFKSIVCSVCDPYDNDECVFMQIIYRYKKISIRKLYDLR